MRRVGQVGHALHRFKLQPAVRSDVNSAVLRVKRYGIAYPPVRAEELGEFLGYRLWRPGIKTIVSQRIPRNLDYITKSGGGLLLVLFLVLLLVLFFILLLPSPVERVEFSVGEGGILHGRGWDSLWERVEFLISASITPCGHAAEACQNIPLYKTAKALL